MYEYFSYDINADFYSPDGKFPTSMSQNTPKCKSL
jgi:hypothetical protein